MEDLNKLFGVTEENWQEKMPLINRYIEIKKELTQLDEKSTRPLRAILTGNETDNDKQILKDIETEAEKLRKELNSLMESNLTI